MGVQSISISQGLANALNAAGNRSGVDFDYLLQTAMRESSLNPEARASTSSAVGLFQFNRSAAQAAVHKRHRSCLLLAVEVSLLVQWESRLPHRVSRLQ